MGGKENAWKILCFVLKDKIMTVLPCNEVLECSARVHPVAPTAAMKVMGPLFLSCFLPST